ncbi:MAG: KH domain-containing protein, partial [Candidatus Diapherotrites archaeon]|nr:KH domain-containing protein [Candidatus Diapherotrites archaeon]
MMIKQRFVSEGILNASLEEYIKKTLSKANIISVSVQKTALVSRVVIEAERPGIVIGKSGSSIKQLQIDLKEKFGIENPQVDVKQLDESPDLSAKLVAKNLAEQISRRPGNTWKRLVGMYVKRIMGAGAQGAEISVKGVIIGKGKPSSKLTEAAGHMKKSGHYVHLVRHGKA